MKNQLLQGMALLATILCLSGGCNPLKNLSPPEYSIEPISKNTYSKLNGTYSNSQDTAFGQIIHQPYRAHNENDISLWNRMFIFSSYKSYEPNTTVDIAFLSSRKAIVNGYLNDKIFSSKTIRGKFKNGYFYPRPRLVLIPFFPLAYIIASKEFDLQNLKIIWSLIIKFERGDSRSLQVDWTKDVQLHSTKP